MLSPLQKMAWFNLIVFAVTVLLYLLALPVLARGFNRSMAEAAVPALGIFGLCGLWGLGGRLFLRNRRSKKKIALDERDQMIYRQAIMAGWSVFWVVLVGVCMVTWGILRYVKEKPTVPVDVLPWLVLGGLIIFTVTQSVVILVQYGRSTSDE